jgi:hypothetical protein
MKSKIIKLVVLFVGFLSSTNLWAQKIKFDKMEHNFGFIKEADGKVSVNYEFTNVSAKPVVITNVQPSCGCTTPSWTKEAVAPGKTGQVIAEYDPANRPGIFEKTVNVFVDSSMAPIMLKFKGEVIPRPKTYQDFYPVEIGNLRATTRNIYINQVYHDGNATQTLKLYNQGNKVINIDLPKSRATLPPHLSLKFDKSAINPQDSAIVQLTFDATKQNDWGYTTAQFGLITDDVNQPDKRFQVGANVNENFGNLVGAAKFPQLSYDRMTHNFGQIQQNTQNKTTFIIKNMGDAPLIIRKTKASCGCTASQPKKMNLAPGESTSIDVTFSSGGKQGKQTQNVTIITNDPTQPQTLLTIEAEVLVPPAQKQGQ